MAKKPKTLDQVLRSAIKATGETLYAVSRDSGIPYATVREFVAEKTDLRLSTAQRLVEYLDLELVPRGKVGRR